MSKNKSSRTVCLCTFGNKLKKCGCQQDKLETRNRKERERETPDRDDV